MEAHVYSTDGKKTGSIALPESVFGVKWNDALMYQVVTVMEANSRRPVAHTKGRGDVRGGGKKPWQQKGTGRARHGSIRSPIWKGGGVTHGPRNEKIYAREIPKKMRAKALFMALSRKLKDGEVLFVDAISFAAPKTAEAKKALLSLSSVKGYEALSGSKRKNLAFIAMPTRDENALKSFNNIGSVEVDAVANLNPVDVLKYKYVVITNPKESVATIEKRAAKKTTK